MKNSFVAKFSSIIIIATLAGCATGNKVESEKYLQVKEGKTTVTELVALMGEPSGRGHQGNKLVLTYFSTKRDAAAYVPLLNLTGQNFSSQSCSFTFNNKGILEFKSCTESKV